MSDNQHRNKRPVEEKPLTGREKKRAKNFAARRINTGEPANAGGGPKAPKVSGPIDVVDFIQARAFEINAMESSIKTASAALNQLAFQSLPRGLRRRAASHNIKRIPVKLREKAKGEMLKGAAPNKTGPPSRKKKRRAATIVEEYLRRQGKKRWLETHIWHAKRMHMKNIWGYRLADYPNEKSLRATYRASSHLSILHDASYMGCVELTGTAEGISRMLAPVTDMSVASIGSQRYSKGHRLGHSTLFHYMAYPQGAICPITFLWQQHEGTSTDRKVWLWIHPASFSEAWECLKEAQEKTNYSEAVAVRDLRDEILMFELTGPRSTALLQAILTTAEPTNNEQTDATSRSNNTKANDIWHCMEHLRSSSSLPAGAVLGITVQDPRLRFPQKLPRRTDVIPPADGEKLQQILAAWPNDVASSDLWNEQVREELRKKKIPEAQLNVRRSKNLLPGTKLELTDADARIPILLVQRGVANPTNKPISSPEYQSGWNIILPKGWGVSFWKSLVFAGCRTAGLREQRAMQFESGKACYPYDYPDTKAYEVWESEQRVSAEAVWERKPPAKRLNYAKLGIEDPFGADFYGLVSTRGNGDVNMENPEGDKPWVLRSTQLLSALAKSSSDLDSNRLAMSSVIDELYRKRQLDLAMKQPTDFGKGLIAVRIVLLDRGTPSTNGRIYLIPSSEQYSNYVRRITTRANKRPADDDLHDSDSDSDLIKENNPDMSCLIGYVTTGQYSYSLGKGLAIGTITLDGLLKLYSIDRSQDRKVKLLVLIKGVQSRVPRPGIIEVLY